MKMVKNCFKGVDFMFTDEEKKAYPLIDKIQRNMQVVALEGESYEGLKGSITEIRYGDQKETENDCILEIVVDFKKPLHGTLEELYPHLNGTGIEQVIMDEGCLGFYFEGETSYPVTAVGLKVK